MSESAAMGETTKVGEANKKVRNRSPEYPTIDLEAALARAQQVYDRESFNAASLNVVLDHWDYGAGSSFGMRVLAALRHYGLVQYEGDTAARKIRLTPLARKILRDPRPVSPDREGAIREAALSPTIFKKLHEAWGASPPSPAQRAYELENEHDFNPRAIPGFLVTYESTMRFAGLDGGAVESDIEDDNAYEPDPDPSNKPGDRGGRTNQSRSNIGSDGNSDPAKVKMQTVTIPLRAGGRTAELTIPEPITKKDFTKIKAWLDWFETSVIEDEDGDEDRLATEV